MAVHTAQEPPVCNADLDSGRRRCGTQVSQLERGGRGTRGVVLVCKRRTEHREQIAAFVAEGELQQVSPERCDDVLNVPDDRVQFSHRVVVAVVVDAGEMHEHRDSGAKLRQELASTGSQSLAHHRKDPRFDGHIGKGFVMGWRWRTVDGTADLAHHGEVASASWVDPERADLDAVPQRPKRRFIEDHVVFVGQLLRGRQRVDESSREHVDELDTRVSHDEPAGSAHGNGGL